jgi:hypothetical protein
VTIVNGIKTGCRLLRYIGLGWVLYRLRYALRRKWGLLARATPLSGWPESEFRPFLGIFKAPESIGSGCLEESDEIASGVYRLFSFHKLAVGFPPNWHRNQMSGEQADASAHWSRLGDFAFGDIKAVWELSRFSWAFALARAYSKTRDERYAEAFWRLFGDWMVHNPPNQGANWMCGQEASFRLMAATFAVDVMAEARASTIGRKRAFSAFAVVTGQRIAANIDYALSQSNNHGISEAVGLVTAALIVPDHPSSKDWFKHGIDALDRQVTDLVYPDGAFSQHSATYHRVLIHDLLWFSAVMRAFGQPLKKRIQDSALKAVRFMHSLMTVATGSVPLYGASDGANILPLADAEYSDFRPVVQAGYAVFGGRKVLGSGPWNELSDWMTGPTAALTSNTARSVGIEAAKENARLHHADGGCLIWRNGRTRLFLRCPTKFRHRPSHADLLHVDIEWQGMPVMIDAGTYSYNAKSPFAWDLKSASVHNTVTFNGMEPMEKLGRFLYLPWPTGKSGWDGTNRFTAEHNGWQRIGCRHVRSVEASEKEGFLIVDQLTSKAESVARIHWLLPDLPYRLDQSEQYLVLQAPSSEIVIHWDFPRCSVKVVQADSDSDTGWCAPHYSSRRSALALSIETRFSGDIRGWTRINPIRRISA